MNTFIKKKGITLIELIIVLGLMSIIIIIVFNFVTLSQKKSKELQTRQELQYEMSMIEESFAKNIMKCSSVVEHNNDNSKVVFRFGDKETITYLKDGDNLNLENEKGEVSNVSSLLDRLSYEKINAGRGIRLEVNLKKSNEEQKNIFEFNFRNFK